MADFHCWYAGAMLNVSGEKHARISSPYVVLPEFSAFAMAIKNLQFGAIFIEATEVSLCTHISAESGARGSETVIVGKKTSTMAMPIIVFLMRFVVGTWYTRYLWVLNYITV